MDSIFLGEFQINTLSKTCMVDHILSPDGKQVWSDDSDLPPYMKSQWIDIERWKEFIGNSRECPLCYSRMEFDLEEGYGECYSCREDFDVVQEKPLTVEHNQDPIMKFFLPLKLEHELLSKKGMEFSVRCHPDFGGPDIDEMIDAINESMNSIKDSILGIVQQAIDEQDGDWYDIYNEYELLEEEKPRYILD